MQNSFNSPDIDSYLAKTQLKFEELKEVIKISIICTEYGSKIVIVPLLAKAVMRNTQILCAPPFSKRWFGKPRLRFEGKPLQSTAR